jgi:GT2 family glycosyltransferase
MGTGSRPSIVLLGLMSRMPVAGNVWLILQFMEGFRRLGYDPYYVEAHAVYPGMLMGDRDADAAEAAAEFIDRSLRPFGFGNCWSFHALHADGRCLGLSDSRLRELYASAALILNVHGGTKPLPEHAATGRLVYIGTDPVITEVELYQGRQDTTEFLTPHAAFFTWGENYGRPDCRVPWTDRFPFKPTRAPVVLDFWDDLGFDPGPTFTTIGNWDQTRRRKDIVLDGQLYTWSKHHEFLKVLDLPGRTGQAFELALSGGSYSAADRTLLEGKGWAVRDALSFTTDLDSYRHYLAQSRGEFTVAKDQNVRLRSGWFSERSAQYLACGRPVITQETGFSNILPTGEGLFAFIDLDSATAAVEAVLADYDRHRRAAARLAREYFSHDVVLTKFLADMGLKPGAGRPVPTGLMPTAAPFGDDLDISTQSRWPTRLRPETERVILAAPLPAAEPPAVSIVVVTLNNLTFTRLCLETLLAQTDGPAYEVIVVDNASADGTVDYLTELAEAYPIVRPVFNMENSGFAAANNQGLSLARAQIFILLNNDTIPTNGWLCGLLHHLKDSTVGLVGPVTNRTGNEAQIETAYRTLGELRSFAADRAAEFAGRSIDLNMLAMYCLAMRRDVFEQVGPLDERFEVGLFEDDDYAERVRAVGLRVVCAEDVFVHHFGQASLGHLANGAYGRLFRANRSRWEAKWGRAWEPSGRRPSAEYHGLVGRVRATVDAVVPPAATVVVVSKGDDALLDLNGRRAWHFPRAADGGYAGYYPADSAEAVDRLEGLRAAGAEYLVIPGPSGWWLDHYVGLRGHLLDSYLALSNSPDCRIFDLAARRPLAPAGGMT